MRIRREAIAQRIEGWTPGKGPPPIASPQSWMRSTRREVALSSMKSKRWYFLVCWLLAFTMCVNAVPVEVGTGTVPAVTRSMGKHLSLEGVPNFGEVTPMLYRGGQPRKEGFDRLARMGIKILVDNGRSTRDERKIKRLGMRFVSLPWYCPFPKDHVFARFLRLIKKNPDKKIFVYCRLGDDRTGMMIAAYRMGEQGWTAEQAMKEMHSFGYTPVHHVICPGLAAYEKSFPERLKKSAAFRELR
jgi:tyrosine-protein phosphatase SIW14